jgi:hypothetical protein
VRSGSDLMNNFSREETESYEYTAEFLDWACSFDVLHPCFQRVHELQQWEPFSL